MKHQNRIKRRLQSFTFHIKIPKYNLVKSLAVQPENPCILSALALLRRTNCEHLYPFPPRKFQHKLPLEFTTTKLHPTSSQPRAPTTVTVWKTRPRH